MVTALGSEHATKETNSVSNRQILLNNISNRGHQVSVITLRLAQVTDLA